YKCSGYFLGSCWHYGLLFLLLGLGILLCSSSLPHSFYILVFLLGLWSRRRYIYFPAIFIPPYSHMRFAMCFPDVNEIDMSQSGIQINSPLVHNSSQSNRCPHS